MFVHGTGSGANSGTESSQPGDYVRSCDRRLMRYLMKRDITLFEEEVLIIGWHGNRTSLRGVVREVYGVQRISWFAVDGECQ